MNKGFLLLALTPPLRVSSALFAGPMQVAPAVKSQMQRRGLALIGFQPVKSFPNCWRMVFAGAKDTSMTTETVDSILDSMRGLSEELFG